MDKRTKEQLVAAQSRAQDEGAAGCPLPALAAGRLHGGDAAGALAALVADARYDWRSTQMACFDLRRVDEQGRLLVDGWLALPTQPDAMKCFALTAPCERCPAPVTHEGHKIEGARCYDHAPHHFTPIASVCLVWTAGEHLDDVLTRGGAAVADLARKALVTWARDSVAGSTSAPTVETMRAALREHGYDVVPLLRWEDIRAWLLWVGFEEAPRHDLHPDAPIKAMRRDETVFSWTVHNQPDDTTLAALGDLLGGMSVRQVREAITRHAGLPAGSWARLSAAERQRAIERKALPPLVVPGTERMQTIRGRQVRIYEDGTPHDWPHRWWIGATLDGEYAISGLPTPDAVTRWFEENLPAAPPPLHPMQVRTASGKVVDLRDPANVRQGMVFWADVYFLIPTRAFTCGERNHGDCWRDAHEPTLGTNVSASAERFLGCDPAVASPEDVAEFGAVDAANRTNANSNALEALNDIARLLDLPAGDDVVHVLPKAVRNIMTAVRVRALWPALRDGFMAVAPLLSEAQRAGLDDLARQVETSVDAVDVVPKSIDRSAMTLEQIADEQNAGPMGGLLLAKVVGPNTIGYEYLDHGTKGTIVPVDDGPAGDEKGAAR